jgi:hypothetical protein
MTYGTEAVMRLFSWPGIFMLMTTAGMGFFASEVVHRRESAVSRYVITSGGEELSEAPPSTLTPPRLLEEIDLTCMPQMALTFGPQSTEPPLADSPFSMIRTTSFELPAAAPDGIETPSILSTMPYLNDDPNAPAILPPLGDVPVLTPVPEADHPLFKAVKKFVDLESANDVTDKVPLGTPPVSEHPSTVTPNKP